MSISAYEQETSDGWSVKRWLGITCVNIFVMFAGLQAAAAMHSSGPMAAGGLHSTSLLETTLELVGLLGLAGFIIGILGLVVALSRP